MTCLPYASQCMCRKQTNKTKKQTNKQASKQEKICKKKPGGESTQNKIHNQTNIQNDTRHKRRQANTRTQNPARYYCRRWCVYLGNSKMEKTKTTTDISPSRVTLLRSSLLLLVVAWVQDQFLQHRGVHHRSAR